LSVIGPRLANSYSLLVKFRTTAVTRSGGVINVINSPINCDENIALIYRQLGDLYSW